MTLTTQLRQFFFDAANASESRVNYVQTRVGIKNTRGMLISPY